MHNCPHCNKETEKDKRGREKKFCSRRCALLYHRYCLEKIKKHCAHCGVCFWGRSSQIFCCRSCKAKNMWENGKCRVPPEVSLRNLRPIPYEGKGKLYGNNRYKRTGKSSKYEHRRIMELSLMRKLESNEHVHHKNGNPRDNRTENLQLVSKSEHAKIHMQERKTRRDL